MLRTTSLCVLVVLLTASSTAAVAQTTRADTQRAAMQECVTALEASKCKLQAEEWEIADLEEYYYWALSIVNLGKTMANSSYDPLTIELTNSDLLQLVELGFVSDWPGDPLNDWKPLPVASVGDEFVPGAVILQVCPASYATTLDGTSSLASYNMFICAPVVSLSTLGPSFSIVGENEEWVGAPPVGALYGLSFYMQSDMNREEVRRKITAEQ